MCRNSTKWNCITTFMCLVTTSDRSWTAWRIFTCVPTSSATEWDWGYGMHPFISATFFYMSVPVPCVYHVLSLLILKWNFLWKQWHFPHHIPGDTNETKKTFSCCIPLNPIKRVLSLPPFLNYILWEINCSWAAHTHIYFCNSYTCRWTMNFNGLMLMC